jgi:hypothetical protein
MHFRDGRVATSQRVADRDDETRIQGITYEFAFIICLIILCNFGNDDWGAVVVDRCIGFEEDEGKGRGLAPGFANWSRS